ncbi:MAG: DUF565 domain-containing protein [Nodosilinea sp.]
MQRTRLSTLIDDIGGQFALWLLNPWRRISLVLISLLSGYFFGVAIAAIAGQAATQDVTISAILVIMAEIISWLVYGRRWRLPDQVKTVPKPLWLDALNSFKLGAIYALCLEAFKLGS